MGRFSKYPYTDFNDLNLDWILQRIREVEAELQRYLENSVITFADPITWDITEQYTALTVVVDSDGTAYLSKQPVPSGVAITNTSYWLPIFNYDDNINTLRSQIAYNAQTSPTTGVALSEGDLVFWNGLIYRALVDMPAGTAFIEGSNVEAYTVDRKINDVSAYVDNTAQTLQQNITDLGSAVETDLDELRDQIAYNAGSSPTITVDLNEGDLVFWEGLMYRTLMDMPAGTAMIEGSNVERYTVDEKINTLIGSDIANIKADIVNINNEIAELDLKTPWYMPEQYGAVADGVTDCTAAFTAMLADMPEGGIAILTGLDYYVSGRLSIDKHDTHIIGLGRGEFTPRILTDLTDGNFITVNNYGCVFDSIELKGPGYASAGDFTLMYFDSANTNGNADALLDKCCFADAHRGIAVSGRNIRVTNSLFSSCAIGTEFLTCAAGDERGHVVQGCRMHLCGMSVKNSIISASAHKNIYIADNFHDFGAAFFYGYAEGVTIIGNYIRNYGFGTAASCIILMHDTMTSSDILTCVKNNVLNGDNVGVSGIIVQGGVKASVNGNTIENFNQNGIAVETGAEVYLTDNIIKKCGVASGTHNISMGTITGVCANNVSVNETIAGGTGATLQNNITITV